MTTERRPTAFARAESGARQVVLQLGLGTLSFVLGSLLVAGLVSRLADRVPAIESETVAWLTGWVLQRLWLVAVLPAFSYLVGRFSGLSLVSFTLTAGLAGEIFGVLLVGAIDGFEPLAASWQDVAARAVTLFAGLWVVHRVGLAGREEAAVDQAEALAVAEQRKAEYAEFLAKAEAGGPKPEPPAAAPGGDAAP
jgi:hypothetical protein